MNVEELLRMGREEGSPDLTVQNSRVLQALAEGNSTIITVKPIMRLFYAVVESPVLALSAVGLLFFVPLHGVVSALGLAEPVYGYILGMLIP